jgi:hypothetical protein
MNKAIDNPNAVRLAGGVFDSDGNPADGDIVVRAGDVDDHPKILVSTVDAYPLKLGDAELAVPLDTAALILEMFGYEVIPPQDDE